MSEYPILFSADMVQAILRGEKTQTRRVAYGSRIIDKTGNPRYKAGDRLWVKETWRINEWDGDYRIAVEYKASPGLHMPWVDFNEDSTMRLIEQTYSELEKLGVETDEDGYYKWEPGQSPLKWRPSIFMPRAASRILLEVKRIGVEYLQDISRNDAIAEGFDKQPYGEIGCFATYWNSLNTKRGFGWDKNPLVIVIKFERLEPK